MKTKLLIKLFFIATFLIGLTELQAQHYPVGSEGIKAGSMPSSGFTFEDENSFYYANKMPGFNGAPEWHNGYSTFSYTQTPRLSWVSDRKVFGANFGAAIRLPIEYKETSYKTSVLGTGGGSGGFPGSPPPIPLAEVVNTVRKSGLADIQVEPVLLSWHLKRFDISTGYSFWAPTGDYDKNRLYFDNIGAGYWTHSVRLGITWYPDSEKTWAISLLNHYDFNTEQYRTVIADSSAPFGLGSIGTTLGNIYTLEWSVSKKISNVNVGVTGYYQQQVTDTEGPAPNGPTYKNERIHVAGIGPEINVSSVKWGLNGSLRYAYEFSAMDHPQGHLISLNLTKSF